MHIETSRARSSCLIGTDKEYNADLYYRDTHLVDLTVSASGATRDRAKRAVKAKVKQLIEQLKDII